jgi:hypothetical protein
MLQVLVNIALNGESETARILAADKVIDRAMGNSVKPTKLNSKVEHCRRIKDERARMHCDQEEDSRSSTNVSQEQPAEPGTWQLARTPNPAGGPDSISIMKIANTTGSDQEVAGLMLRCGEGATTQVLVVLIDPLPPRTHPKVTVVAGATTTEFTASVVTPGALVLLPEKASALVEGAWESVPELSVSISENRRSLHGVIPLADAPRCRPCSRIVQRQFMAGNRSCCLRVCFHLL